MSFKYVNDLWNDAEVEKLSGVGRLVYRSNKLGSDQRITNTGGGNTSSKLQERDPLTGDSIEVLWVKGSGGDLRTSTAENFSSLYQSELIGLQKLYAAQKNKGPKSQAEDDMVAAYNHCTFNLNPRAPSIDLPLHSFIPAKFVDHMHPNAIIAIAASANCKKLTKEIFGDEMEYVEWMRPGFELGLAMQEICRRSPNTKAIMMGQHSSNGRLSSSKKNMPKKAATRRPLAARSFAGTKSAAKSFLPFCRGCEGWFHSRSDWLRRSRTTKKSCGL
jgi:rhamnose utilization protein RhaD (predicted bifunctional aldolase and dehydrogenase)